MRNLYDFFSGSSGESFTDQSPPGDFSKYSETMSSACLVQGTRMSSFIPLCAVPSHQHATQLLFHTYTHTQSAAALTKLVGHSLAPVLFSSASASATCSSARLPSVLVLWTSVGAGCNGLLQLQGSWAMLEIAVAGLTDTTGLKQLLAWHWDPLVATAGTEHVTAVPAKEHGDVIWGTLTFFTPQVTMRPCGRFLENNTSFKTVYLNWTDVRSWVFCLKKKKNNN